VGVTIFRYDHVSKCHSAGCEYGRPPVVKSLGEVRLYAFDCRAILRGGILIYVEARNKRDLPAGETGSSDVSDVPPLLAHLFFLPLPLVGFRFPLTLLKRSPRAARSLSA